MIYLHECDLLKITKTEFSNSDFFNYNWGLMMGIIDAQYDIYLLGQRDIEEMSNNEFEEFKQQIKEYLDAVNEEMWKPTR